MFDDILKSFMDYAIHDKNFYIYISCALCLYTVHTMLELKLGSVELNDILGGK